MIGEESMTSRSPGPPTRTGQVRTLEHEAAAEDAQSGGVRSETKAPPETPRRVWTPTIEERSASSRGDSGSLHGVTFSTAARTFHSGGADAIGTASTRSSPAIAWRSRTS